MERNGSGTIDVGDALRDSEVGSVLELSDGRAVITEYYPSGPITGFDEDYTVFKDVIEFQGSGGPPMTARWNLDGKRLRFTDVGGERGDQFVWGRTWIKTG